MLGGPTGIGVDFATVGLRSAFYRPPECCLIESHAILPWLPNTPNQPGLKRLSTRTAGWERETGARIGSFMRRGLDVLGVPITGAAFSVPPSLPEGLRMGVLNAARSAGLGNVTLVDDPLAAVLAHVHDRRSHGSFIVCGVGRQVTFASAIRVEGTAGIVGSRVDHGIGSDDLLLAVDGAPSSLAAAHERLFAREGGDLADADAVRRILDRMIAPLDDVLRTTTWSSPDVDHVLLVGGGVRSPTVRRAFESVLGRPGEIQPLDAVARGSAIYALSVLGDCLSGTGDARGASVRPARPDSEGDGVLDRQWRELRSLMDSRSLGPALPAYEAFLERAHCELAFAYGQRSQEIDPATDTTANERRTLIEQGLRHDATNLWIHERAVELVLKRIDVLLSKKRVDDVMRLLGETLERFPRVDSLRLYAADFYGQLATIQLNEAKRRHLLPSDKVYQGIRKLIERSLALNAGDAQGRAAAERFAARGGHGSKPHGGT